MQFAPIGRMLVRLVFAAALLEVMGGVILGSYFHWEDGRVTALTILFAGAATSLLLWYWSRGVKTNGFLDTMVRVSFCGCGGLAVYANLGYALWAAGVPLELGVVRDGHMGEHFWLGPFTAAYALFCWASMRYSSRPKTR
jgi:hypothetical protein